MSETISSPASPRLMRIGVVQMAALSGDRESNLSTAERYVDQLAQQGANLVVLPELFASGYDLGIDLSSTAEPTDGPSTQRLIGWAARYGLVIVTALLTREPDGELIDTAMVIDHRGIVASASKQYLWGGESSTFSQRIESSALAETDIGRVGVAICYEAGFPEVVRDLAVRGADIIAIPAAFGRNRLYAWELLTRSRALENGCFVAAAGLTSSNRTGAHFAGHSRVVSPTGEILAGLGEAPGVAMAVVDFDDIERSRRAIPYLTDLASRPISAANPPSTTVQTPIAVPLEA